MVWTWIILIIIAVAVWMISMFNGLVVLKNRVDESASDIDVQLKRRHDLIPNLIKAVEGYASHERELFEKVTVARAQAVSAGERGDLKGKAAAENVLTHALRSVFAVAENYPELKASENFRDLQEELADTENKVMSARDYNTRREIFPVNIFSNMFNFKHRDLFELEDIAERSVPEVKF